VNPKLSLGTPLRCLPTLEQALAPTPRGPGVAIGSDLCRSHVFYPETIERTETTPLRQPPEKKSKCLFPL
jgi:hypothetical protein